MAHRRRRKRKRSGTPSPVNTGGWARILAEVAVGVVLELIRSYTGKN